MEIANFEKLRVYQAGLELVNLIYQITKGFPKDELFCLTSQLRRAVISIVLNIAEGQGRKGKSENKQFVLIARGSVYEILAILEISSSLGYITDAQKIHLREKLFSLLKQLNQLINYLQQK